MGTLKVIKFKIMKGTIRTAAIALVGLFTFGCAGRGPGGDSGEPEGPVRFFVGSSDGSLEHSIFLCEFDPGAGKFSIIDSFAGAVGPSYLAFSPERDYLYAIDDAVSDTILHYQSVSAFAVHRETSLLEFLNRQSSQGSGPCHVFCSKSGSHLFVANYNSGHVASFPLSDRGRISPASSVVTGEGSGPVQGRQEGPHAHQVMMDPDNNFLLVPDLGADKIQLFAFDEQAGTLVPNPHQPFLKLAPGSGPRHLVFHPSGDFVYVVNELNATVTACSYNRQNGALTELMTESTVDETHKGSKYPAAVRIDPRGNHLYASTRGEVSSIAVFEVGVDGLVRRIQVEEDVPAWPRDFNIDPSGRYLIAAGERSNTIELYRIQQESGTLQKAGISASIPSPGCVLFIE